MFFDAPANLVRTATSMHVKKLESAQNDTAHCRAKVNYVTIRDQTRNPAPPQFALAEAQ